MSQQITTTNACLDEVQRNWYDHFLDVYDTENCLFQKKIIADHRNQIRLYRADMLLADLKLPDILDADTLWLDRRLIEPLEQELM